MGGIDAYDWSIFGGNPVPGDPDGVRAIAARFMDLADGVAQQSGLLRSVGTDSEAIWVGPAAGKFRPHITKLPGQLAKLVTSYRDAADALNGFWPKLAAAQALAITALAKARAAQYAIDAANSAVSSASAAASSAAATYNNAAAALAATASAGTAQSSQVQSLQAGYQSAQSNLSAANAALSAANAEMAAAQQLKDQAVAQARSASSACAGCLHSASAAGIQNPHHSWLTGIFDDVGSLATAAWHCVESNWQTIRWFVPGYDELLLTEDAGQWLSDHWVEVLKDASVALGVISTVAGLVSLIPLVGEVALPVALLSAGLQTVDDTVLAATGDGSWWTVSSDAISDVGFGVGEGLTHLAFGEVLVDTLTGDVTKATQLTSDLTSEVSALSDAAGSWAEMGDRAVVVVGPDGTAEMTSASDLVAELQGGVAGKQSELETTTATLADLQSQLKELPPQVEARWRYALSTFSPGEDGTVDKVGRFFDNPVTYAQQRLANDPGLANDTDVSMTSRIAKEWSELWSGAGKVPYRISVGVGVANAGWDAWTTGKAAEHLAVGRLAVASGRRP